MFGDDEDNPQAHYRPRHHYGGGHAYVFITYFYIHM